MRDGLLAGIKHRQPGAAAGQRSAVRQTRVSPLGGQGDTGPTTPTINTMVKLLFGQM